MTAPNIVLIILDDATFEQMQRLPQVMKLAATGVNFMNAYASTALCQVARMTFLTGQYSHNHGVPDNGAAGNSVDHTTMLPNRLKAVGYNTCHIGKYLNSWDIANPVPTGWDDWHQNNPQQYFGYSLNDNGVTTTPPDYHTTMCGKRALTFITGATQPFFMQIGFKAPHYDQPTTEFLNPTPDAVYSGVIPTFRLSPRNPNFNVQMGTPPAYMAHAAMDQTKINAIDAFWRGSTEELFSVNKVISDIQAALISTGKTNTVIILTSDNGIFRGEGRDPSEKVAPYLPDLRIPLIISGPSNLVAQNKTCDKLACHIDIAATIYALSGATSTRTVDGLSLTPYLVDPNSAALRHYLLLEWRSNQGGTGWPGIVVPFCRTVISSSYFYTEYDGSGEAELYDLIKDPYQLINQINVPAYAAAQADMASKLNTLKNCSGSSCTI